MSYQTTTGRNKQRSYNGDYMELGKRGEGVVLDWLKAHPAVIGVDDLRELRPMQAADVDAGIHLYSGRVVLAEIKTDAHLGKTPNVIFEVLRINHTAKPDYAGTLGWSLRSPAKWLLFYASSVNAIYRITFDDYRAGFQRYTLDTRKGSRVSWVSTDNIKSTVNILVPSGYFEKNWTVYSLDDNGAPF